MAAVPPESLEQRLNAVAVVFGVDETQVIHLTLSQFSKTLRTQRCDVASIMSTRYVEVLESVHDKITFVGKIRENSKRLGG
jgi:hypothetical protein